MAWNKHKYNEAMFNSHSKGLSLEGGRIRLEFTLPGYVNSESVEQATLQLTGGDDNLNYRLYVYDVLANKYETLVDGTKLDLEQVLPSDLSPYISSDGKINFVVDADREIATLTRCRLVTEVAGLVMPRVIFSGINLLKNPGFERELDGWTDPQAGWGVDFVQYYEGSICAVTKALNAPLHQDFFCVGGEHLTFTGVFKGTNPTDMFRVRLEYFDGDGKLLDGESKSYNVVPEHAEIWFSTTKPTPDQTHRARLIITKIEGDSSSPLYVDQLMIRIGGFEQKPAWANHTAKELQINGVVGRSDTLRIDLGARSVDLNGLYSQYHRVSGEFFVIPAGKTIITVVDGENSSHLGEIFFRYDEVWD